MGRLQYFLLLGVFLLSVAAMASDARLQMVMVNQRPMISLRDFAETLNATVDYQVDRDEISITLDETTVYLRPYSMTAWINNRKVCLDMPVIIIDDVTYLPLGFMGDAFGLRYDWTSDNRQCTVIGRWTQARMVLVIDLDWGRRPHTWQHDYDLSVYVNFHTRHDERGDRRDNHGAPWGRNDQYYNGAPQGGPGQHHDRDARDDGFGRPDGHDQRGAYPPQDGDGNRHDRDGGLQRDNDRPKATAPADGMRPRGDDRQYGDTPRRGGAPDVREVRPGDDKQQRPGAADQNRKDREKQDGGNQPNNRDHQTKRTGRH